MPIRRVREFAILAVMGAALAACSGKASPSPTSPATQAASPAAQTQLASTETATSPTATSAAANDLCANPLAPVKAGATWTYKNTGGAVSPSTFTTTISDVRADGFTVQTKLDDAATTDQQWACKQEGLLAQSLGAGAGGLDLSMQGINADIQTSNATGVTIPANVQPGMSWTYGLDIAGTLSQGNLSGDVDGTVTNEMKAIGTESTSVPAGTFDAMKIESKSTFQVTVDYKGLSLPITSVVNTTFWFAPGVGWIKSVETGELAGTPVNTTTELQSYNIP